MADNKKKGVTGNGVYTVGDPNVAKDAIGKVDWIAVKVGGADGATPEQIEALKKALEGSGTELVIWQSTASQEGVDAVNQYGAAGYIAQAETPDELAAAKAVEDQINVPKSIVTDKNITSDPSTMSEWGWMIEYFPNDPNTGWSQQNLADIVRWWKEQGADDITVVIGSWGTKTMSMEEYQRQMESLRAAGFDIDNLASYRWDMMSQEQRDAFLEWLGGLTESGGAGNKTPDYIAGNPGTGDSGDAQRAKELAARAPDPYSGGTDAIDSWSFFDSKGRANTITVTKSGAVVQQVEGKTPYRIGWVDPDKYVPGSRDLSTMVSGDYDKNPYTVGFGTGDSGDAANAKEDAANLAGPTAEAYESDKPPTQEIPGVDNLYTQGENVKNETQMW